MLLYFTGSFTELTVHACTTLRFYIRTLAKYKIHKDRSPLCFCYYVIYDFKTLFLCYTKTEHIFFLSHTFRVTKP